MNYDSVKRTLSAPLRHAGLLMIAATLALAYGIWYAYSVFLVALLEEFGWQRSVLAAGFSVFAVVHGLTNPIVGHLCDRVRPAILIGIGGVGIAAALWSTSNLNTPLELYLRFGVMTSLAVAVCGWVPAVVLVQRRYQHRLGLALGIVSAGVGVGMLLVVPVCQLLIDQFGWRSAYRILGLSCAALMIPAAIFLSITSRGTSIRRVTTEHKAAIAKSITLNEAMRTLPFWLMVSAFLFGSICSQTLHVHQVAFLVDHGLAALAAASVVSVVGLASIVAKIGGGWLSDRIAREIIFMVSAVILLASIAVLMWVGQHPSLIGAYLFGVLLGVGYSAVAAITPAMVSDRFSGRNYGSIFGMCLLGSAMGSALGPWMAGAIFDVTGSYTLPLIIAGVCGVITLLSGWFAYRLRRPAVSA